MLTVYRYDVAFYMDLLTFLMGLLIIAFDLLHLPYICSYSFDRMYSELISSTIAEGGPFASKTSFVKLLR